MQSLIISQKYDMGTKALGETKKCCMHIIIKLAKIAYTSPHCVG